VLGAFIAPEIFTLLAEIPDIIIVEKNFLKVRNSSLGTSLILQ